jgi:hypothetical protein
VKNWGGCVFFQCSQLLWDFQRTVIQTFSHHYIRQFLSFVPSFAHSFIHSSNKYLPAWSRCQAFSQKDPGDTAVKKKNVSSLIWLRAQTILFSCVIPLLTPDVHSHFSAFWLWPGV